MMKPAIFLISRFLYWHATFLWYLLWCNCPISILQPFRLHTLLRPSRPLCVDLGWWVSGPRCKSGWLTHAWVPEPKPRRFPMNWLIEFWEREFLEREFLDIQHQNDVQKADLLHAHPFTLHIFNIYLYTLYMYNICIYLRVYTYNWFHLATSLSRSHCQGTIGPSAKAGADWLVACTCGAMLGGKFYSKALRVEANDINRGRGMSVRATSKFRTASYVIVPQTSQI